MQLPSSSSYFCRYVMGIGEAEIFSVRLKRELRALEAANVHAILETENLVDEVLQGLESATICTEDMDEWLALFNVKVRHMREDIEAVCLYLFYLKLPFTQIETRNNMLEMQWINYKSLVTELEKLLARLNIPPEVSSCLASGTFDESHMSKYIEACDWIRDDLHGFDSALDPRFAKIRVVKEKNTCIAGSSGRIKVLDFANGVVHAQD